MSRSIARLCLPLAAWMMVTSLAAGDDVEPAATTYSASIDSAPTPAIYTTSLDDAYSASLADESFAASIEDIDDYRGGDVDFVGYHDDLGLGGKSSCGKGCSCGDCRGNVMFSRTFASFDFLQWYSKDRSVPSLVTTNAVPPPAVNAGVLPGATVLFGNGGIGGDRQAGGRLTVGLWLDDSKTQSLGFRFYANEGEDETFNAASNGNPVLARPYFDSNILVNAPAAFLLAYPGLTTGSVGVSSKNDVIGGEVFARSLLRSDHDFRIDWLAGYQFNRIDDDLVMNSIATSAGVTTTMLDIFDVHNEFHAGQLGLIADVYRGCWTMTVMGKLAVGNMRQRATINGQYSTNGFGARTGPGGLMAQPTNMGIYERDVTVWSPEGEIKLSYALNDRISMSLGYSILYWNRVALAGDLIDNRVNSAQITNGGLPFAGPNDPSFAWRDTDFWVQTVNVGLNWNY